MREKDIVFMFVYFFQTAVFTLLPSDWIIFTKPYLLYILFIHALFTCIHCLLGVYLQLSFQFCFISHFDNVNVFF